MQFDYWTVLKRDEPHKGARNSYWICKCKCGTIKSLTRTSLLRGESKSCGCRHSDKLKGINKTHGMSNTRLYHEWLSMRYRCNRKTGKDSKTYYNNGISVCDEWASDFTNFMEWALSNGYNDSLTIDRIDNSKGYSPQNCRWVTNDEQQQNKTNTIYVDYNGEKRCLRTLCTEIGFSYKTAYQRYRRLVKTGKPITQEALFAPVRKAKS